MATNITIQTISTGDNELMKIDVYLAARFGPGSDKARTTMQELSELKKMLADEVVHFVFEKADGTTRDAYGTRAVDVIRLRRPATSMQTSFFTLSVFLCKAMSGISEYWPIIKKIYAFFLFFIIIDLHFYIYSKIKSIQKTGAVQTVPGISVCGIMTANCKSPIREGIL